MVRRIALRRRFHGTVLRRRVSRHHSPTHDIRPATVHRPPDTEAGVGEPIARAHAEALREALLETVVTKADLREAVEGLDRRIEVFRQDLKGSVDAVDRKVDVLDRKIEITARDLVIKGAGGLIVIATLMTRPEAVRLTYRPAGVSPARKRAASFT